MFETLKEALKEVIVMKAMCKTEQHIKQIEKVEQKIVECIGLKEIEFAAENEIIVGLKKLISALEKKENTLRYSALTNYMNASMVVKGKLYAYKDVLEALDGRQDV